MNITFLGTGHAATTELYNTCFVVSEGTNRFMVDAGGGNGVLKQLKECNIPLSEIHDVFITHAHTDHIIGVVWIIRIIASMMRSGEYEGKLTLYSHDEVLYALRTMCNLMADKFVLDRFDKDIIFDEVTSGDKRSITGNEVTFFDIGSPKKKQFGFSLLCPTGEKLVCLGDEPFHPCEEVYVSGCDWLLHEAFCLYSERDIFEPYKKNHSTPKDASELAERLGVKNLVLYHTEESHLPDRVRLYYEDGKQYYHGNLYVPNDLETIEMF